MRGWLVNDKLTCIPGTRTLWHDLLRGLDGLEDHTTGTYQGLAEQVEDEAVKAPPDYIIRNASYFRPLDLDVPTLALVQDIHGDPNQYAVCCGASKVIYNSKYTHSFYRELDHVPHEIIPVGTDFDLFRIRPSVYPEMAESVLYVGSTHAIKGWPLLMAIAESSGRPFVCVLKDTDNVKVPKNVTIYCRLQQTAIANLAASCKVGICTSMIETQHLAGIEMGACGLPMVASNVGIYYDRPAGAWGRNVTHRERVAEWVAALETHAPRQEVRDYWLREGLDRETCIRRWRAAVDSIVGVRA